MADPYWRYRVGSGRAAARMLSRLRNLPVELQRAGVIADRLAAAPGKKPGAIEFFAEVKRALKDGERRALERLKDEV